MRIDQYDYTKMVIDTGPLIDALTLELLERAPECAAVISSKSPLDECLYNNPAAQQNFRNLLDRAKEILITSHVIGEIRSRVHAPGDRLHAIYWQSWMDFLDKHNVAEKLITLREMNADERLRGIVRLVGPTDAGVIALADREKCLVLTRDGRLYNWGRSFPEVKIEMVKNVVSY
jgi:rRNA-processing protein FCF1